MAYSAKFGSLDRRIKTLRKQFLPTAFSKTGTYSDEQLDKARAFRLLAHAEIEEYIEGRALEIASDAVKLWGTHRKHSRVVLHLTANQSGNTQGFPVKLGSAVSAKTIVEKCFAQYRHTVRNNNGIRTANILALLLPVGVDEAEIDAAWLATIDGFGVKRGAAAHSSSVSYTIDPHSDFKTVQSVVEGLKDVDSLLNGLKRTLR